MQGIFLADADWMPPASIGKGPLGLIPEGH